SLSHWSLLWLGSEPCDDYSTRFPARAFYHDAHHNYQLISHCAICRSLFCWSRLFVDRRTSTSWRTNDRQSTTRRAARRFIFFVRLCHPRPQNSALHRPGIGMRKFCENLIEPYQIAGGALRKLFEENPPAVM